MNQNERVEFSIRKNPCVSCCEEVQVLLKGTFWRDTDIHVHHSPPESKCLVIEGMFGKQREFSQQELVVVPVFCQWLLCRHQYCCATFQCISGLSGIKDNNHALKFPEQVAATKTSK